MCYFEKSVISVQTESLTLLETVLFPFVKHVRPCSSNVHNFWTTVSLQAHNTGMNQTDDQTEMKRTHILLLNRALLAVMSVRDADATTNHATAFVRAVVALVTHARQCMRFYIRVAHYTLAVACGQHQKGDTKRDTISKQRRRINNTTFRRAVCMHLHFSHRRPIAAYIPFTILSQARVKRGAKTTKTARTDARLLAAHNKVRVCAPTRQQSACCIFINATDTMKWQGRQTTRPNRRKHTYDVLPYSQS